jgi:catechol 2,3-dioxygenase-like lactoylglutathione lyase family enzyme
MHVTGIDHVNIAATPSLIEEVRRFYVDVLGLSEGYRPAFSSEGHWLYAAEQALVHLSVRTGRAEPAGNGPLDHVAFRVSDPAPLIERLDRAGIAYRRTEIAEMCMGQLFFQDPAGNGLEVNFISAG